MPPIINRRSKIVKIIPKEQKQDERNYHRDCAQRRINQASFVDVTPGMDTLKPEMDRFRVNSLALASTPNGYKQSRRYDDYDDSFGSFLPHKSILAELEMRYSQTKEPLTILDDGAGKGGFLTDLYHFLMLRKIPNSLDAVSLADTSNILKAKRRLGFIRNLYLDFAENISIREKYDAIFSYFGSVDYTHSETKKDLLLKYAYSLKKGGFACITFSFDDYFIEDWVLEKKYGVRQLRNESEFKNNIVKSFERRGFEARFHVNRHGSDVLIIRRIK